MTSAQAQHTAALPAEPQESARLRPPDEVMRLERLGRLHGSRLSFTRTIVRRMMQQRWRIERVRFELDDDGLGTAVYRVVTRASRYHFVVFAQRLADHERTDRVIAHAWDCAVALVEGDLDGPRLQCLRENVPRQEAGRVDANVLVLSRANRSVRNFDAVVRALAEGRQPEVEWLARVGYLYRTTAVYGNGKFGLADYPRLCDRDDFGLPFAAQLFAVYLLRHFSIEQVEHIAACRAPATAVSMDRRLQRFLGIGNSTGLGMAPFLVNHPQLIGRWLLVRETALARCLDQPAGPARQDRLLALIERACRHARETVTEDERQARENATLVAQLEAAHRWLAAQEPRGRPLWRELADHAREHWSLETQELLHSLVIELYPERVDELERHTGASEEYDLEPDMALDRLLHLIETRYDWAVAIDFGAPGAEHYFWYRSAEKEEPRLGVRDAEPGADREMPLDVARQVRRAYDIARAYRDEHGGCTPVIELLLEHPGLRGIVRRIQCMAQTRYGEIRANLLSRDLLPMDLLRCKLSFFGATKFDPQSSRWVRITLFQGAPLVEDIGGPFDDDWLMPPTPSLDGEHAP